MKLLIDANVILDILQERQPHYDDSLAVWEFCEQKFAEGFISALTFANIMYVLRKDIDADDIARLFRMLKHVLSIAPLTEVEMRMAADMLWKDFEDALQAATAHSVAADYIVTRNKQDFKDSSVPSITPKEFLQSVPSQIGRKK